MLLNIKLYGGLTCCNQSLKSFGLKNFEMQVPQGTTILEIHKLLNIVLRHSPVTIVDGHAQHPDYVIDKDCSVSIFPPMADRKYNLFDKL